MIVAFMKLRDYFSHINIGSKVGTGSRFPSTDFMGEQRTILALQLYLYKLKNLASQGMMALLVFVILSTRARYFVEDVAMVVG
jgi:hypothetical protein